MACVKIFTISLYYLCCIGEARNAREAGVYFIFMLFVHWLCVLLVPCSNLIADNFTCKNTNI